MSRWTKRLVGVLAGLSVALSAGTAAAQWRYRVSTNPLTDQPITVAAATATGGAAVAAVRCYGGQIETFLIADGYLDEDGAEVRWRFDKRRADQDYWPTTTTGAGVVSPYPGIMAREMAGASRLVFEVEDFRGAASQFVFEMAGSSAAISRVMADCDVPMTDPRDVDSTIWRRVIDTVDGLHKDDVRTVQSALIALGQSDLQPTGRRDLATYRAASALWVKYWNECDRLGQLSASCHLWILRGRGDNYPVDIMGLLVEWLQNEELIAARMAGSVAVDVRPSLPSLRASPADPVWAFRPAPEDLAAIAPKAAVGAAVELDCNVGPGGILRDCNVVREDPLGHGFGAAAADEASRLFRRREDGRGGYVRQRVTVEFPAPPTPAVALPRTAE